MTNTTLLTIRRCYRWLLASLCLAAGIGLVGCGGQPKATVTGKVTFKGSPVTGGTLTFGPVGDKNPGKSASGTVKSDGTYTLTTEREGDGAIIGKHKVTYTPPEPDLTEEQRTDPKYIAKPSPYINTQPKTKEVDVNAGANTIDIELVPLPPRNP